MHPTLFHLPVPPFVVAVHAYGASLALAVLIGWYLVRRDPRMHDELVGRLYFLTVVVSLLGARLVYLFTAPQALRGPFDVLSIGDGGLVAFGGVLVALLLYPRVRELSREERISVAAAEYADALALPGLVACALTSIGAYLAGSDFGRPLAASAPRLLRALGTFPRFHAREGTVGRFLEGPPVLLHQIDAYPDRIAPVAAWSLPTHPVQLYEAVLAALFALGLFAYERRAPARGSRALAAVLAYGLVRLATDPFRGDPERVRWGVVTLPAILATVTVLVAAALIGRRLYLDRSVTAA